MTLQECYAQLGADFEGTLGRLCNERLVGRFALAFLEDNSFSSLKKALEEENYEEAFRSAHTLKGICLNLGFTRLREVSEQLTEALRNGKKPEDNTLYEKAEAEYSRTVSLLKELRG